MRPIVKICVPLILIVLLVSGTGCSRSSELSDPWSSFDVMVKAAREEDMAEFMKCLYLNSLRNKDPNIGIPIFP